MTQPEGLNSNVPISGALTTRAQSYTLIPKYKFNLKKNLKHPLGRSLEHHFITENLTFLRYLVFIITCGLWVPLGSPVQFGQILTMDINVLYFTRAEFVF